jgi:NAD(P)-dependent dehydrogenase (short-subunit alcohol dehydrogenase family)
MTETKKDDSANKQAIVTNRSKGVAREAARFFAETRHIAAEEATAEQSAYMKARLRTLTRD